MHPRFKTPYIGTIITGLFVATFAAFANIAEVGGPDQHRHAVRVRAGVGGRHRAADGWSPTGVRPFRVPWVPLTPMISIVTCLYLMLQLPRITWIRFGVWLLLGLVIYFLYGMRHSRLGAGRRGARRGQPRRRRPLPPAPPAGAPPAPHPPGRRPAAGPAPP